MACHLFSGMPLSESMMDDLVLIGPLEKHGYMVLSVYPFNVTIFQVCKVYAGVYITFLDVAYC